MHYVSRPYAAIESKLMYYGGMQYAGMRYAGLHHAWMKEPLGFSGIIKKVCSITALRCFACKIMPP